jgi:hypothetical protein
MDIKKQIEQIKVKQVLNYENNEDPYSDYINQEVNAINNK